MRIRPQHSTQECRAFLPDRSSVGLIALAGLGMKAGADATEQGLQGTPNEKDLRRTASHPCPAAVHRISSPLFAIVSICTKMVYACQSTTYDAGRSVTVTAIFQATLHRLKCTHVPPARKFPRVGEYLARRTTLENWWILHRLCHADEAPAEKS